MYNKPNCRSGSGKL